MAEVELTSKLLDNAVANKYYVGLKDVPDQTDTLLSTNNTKAVKCFPNTPTTESTWDPGAVFIEKALDNNGKDTWFGERKHKLSEFTAKSVSTADKASEDYPYAPPADLGLTDAYKLTEPTHGQLVDSIDGGFIVGTKGAMPADWASPSPLSPSWGKWADVS